MKFSTFERMSRCFLIIICAGMFALTISILDLQKFTFEMSNHIFKGFLYSQNHYLLKEQIIKTVTNHTDNTTIADKLQTNINNRTEINRSNSYQLNTSKKSQLDTFTLETRGLYTVINNFIQAINRPAYNVTITLCTQGTYNFLHHVSVLCTRWQGSLSVAIYAPGEDFFSAVDAITYLRKCGPPCVKQNVSWHMIYDTAFPPNGNSSERNKKQIDCRNPLLLKSDFKKNKGLLYPINVARNVARLRANTRYIFSSDIELYPSFGIIPKFLEMVRKENVSNVRRVYAVPVFEVKKKSNLPNSKSELVALMKNGSAVFFHKYICDACQRFPEREAWLKDIPKDGSLDVFRKTKRNSTLSSWEPIYIGTNKEPLYEERLSWEGKKDKMSQMYELCLMDYQIYILNNAFLVHTPGIKMGKAVTNDHKRRLKYVQQNNQLYKKILKDLQKKYPKHSKC